MVSALLQCDHAITAYTLAENGFRMSRGPLRTLGVGPPMVNGRVRVVEIAAFDAQECGATRLHATREPGSLSIFHTGNKGRINRRLCVRLDPAA